MLKNCFACIIEKVDGCCVKFPAGINCSICSRIFDQKVSACIFEMPRG